MNILIPVIIVISVLYVFIRIILIPFNRILTQAINDVAAEFCKGYPEMFNLKE